MKNHILSRIFNRSLLSIIALISNILVFAQPTPPLPASGVGGNGPGEPEQTPIDMYEGILLLVAVSLIIGYYLYKRNRRIA